MTAIAYATPTQIQLHRERLARLARMQVAATQPKPKRPRPAPLARLVLHSGWFQYRRPAPYDSWDCMMPPAETQSWRKIVYQVCLKHDVCFEEVIGAARTPHIIRARHEACYRLREE